MNIKFYVSLEAARLLKEKGYNRECIAYYQNDEFHPYSVDLFKLSISDKNAAPSYMNQYSAPTKAEAIDWLESKGIVVEVQYRRLTGKYFSEIHYNKMRYKCRPSDLTEDFSTRLEAEDAAIIKALELL
jgi:ATP-dependent DNA ligase